MFDGKETLELLAALEDGATASELDALLRRPDLSRMLPSVGIPRAQGIEYLRAVSEPTLREGMGEEGTAVFDYFRELLAQKGEFEAIVMELEARGTDMARSAFEKTRGYLPGTPSLGTPRFVFLPTGFDFRTDRETVYMDPLASILLGKDGFRDTLAHELHHVARYRLTGTNLTLMGSGPEDQPADARSIFREWARWLEAEGIADCVDNMTQHDVPPLRPAVAQRRRQMESYAALLGAAIEHLRRSSESPQSAAGEREELKRELRGLAHPVGYRLADTIERGFGRPTLIECVGHPERFLRSYNEVAKLRGLGQVDPAFVNWLVPEQAAK